MSFDIGSALLGALASGLVQAVMAHFDRKRESESILVAIASEVDSICRLIQHQGYLEATSKIAQDIDKGMWNGVSYIIDIRSNYFTVFEGLVSKLGHLKPQQANQIVNFYAYCKSTIDSTRPDGPHALEPNSAEAALNMVSVSLLLRSVLSLGGEIVKLPKKPILRAEMITP